MERVSKYLHVYPVAPKLNRIICNNDNCGAPSHLKKIRIKNKFFTLLQLFLAQELKYQSDEIWLFAISGGQ